jgi:hypothetical protein
LAPISQRLASVFDSVIDTLAGPGTQEIAGNPNDDNPQKTIAKGHTGLTIATSSDDNSKGVGKLIFELWLWLQFCIIIFVFLWTLAKRGPKSVLDDAAKKRITKHCP